MIRNFRDRFSDFFGLSSPILNEHSSLQEILAQYPQGKKFVERKYGIPIETDDKVIPLKDFATKYGLPPAPILFMEIQMAEHSMSVTEITVFEAQKLIEKIPELAILDVREEWEVKVGKLKSSMVLTSELLDQILNQWSKDTPVLLYCHHGIRSLDAAHFLADRGFRKIFSLRGGIDAWSTHIDPTIPRYQGPWC